MDRDEEKDNGADFGRSHGRVDLCGCGSGPAPGESSSQNIGAGAGETLILSEPGNYTEKKEYGDVVLKADGIVLENALIHGSLTVDKTVGEGDATLRGCTVEGDVYLYGGGSHSVHFENCILNTLIAEKKGLRVVLDSRTQTGAVSVRASARFEISAAVERVLIETGAADSELLFTEEAQASKVTLNAAARLEQNCPLEELNVGRKASAAACSSPQRRKRWSSAALVPWRCRPTSASWCSRAMPPAVRSQWRRARRWTPSPPVCP